MGGGRVVRLSVGVYGEWGERSRPARLALPLAAALLGGRHLPRLPRVDGARLGLLVVLGLLHAVLDLPQRHVPGGLPQLGLLRPLLLNDLYRGPPDGALPGGPLTFTRRRRAAPDSWSLLCAFRNAKVHAILEGFLRWL